MSSPESPKFQEQETQTPIVETPENSRLEIEGLISDRFWEMLDKAPSTKKIVGEIKNHFNEMERSTNRAFDDSLDSAKNPERLGLIKDFAEVKTLEYFSLHEALIEKLDFVSELTEEEKEEIIQESGNTAVLYEGRTLLSFYANRNNEKKKSINSPVRNTENAALQQSLAKYYLRHPDDLENIEQRLDNYGKKVLGSEEEYESLKRGVISLANAYKHLESLGNNVFFPPPEMDALQEIDLLCIENSDDGGFGETEKAFFNSNFSVEELKKLDPDLLSCVYGVQVKTGHNLEEIYGNIGHGFDNPETLDELLEEMSLDESCFDCLDENVVKETTVFSNLVKDGVNHCKSIATIFKCPSVERSPYSYNENFYEKITAMDQKIKKVVNDIQSSVNFSRQIPEIGSEYLFVENLQKEQARSY